MNDDQLAKLRQIIRARNRKEQRLLYLARLKLRPKPKPKPKPPPPKLYPSDAEREQQVIDWLNQRAEFNSK